MIASSPNLHGTRPNISTGHCIAFIRIPEEGFMGLVRKTNHPGALASLRMLLSWGIWWVCNPLPQLVPCILLPRPFTRVRIGVGPPIWYYYCDVLLLIERINARVSRASPGATDSEGCGVLLFMLPLLRTPEGGLGGGRRARALVLCAPLAWGSYVILDSGSTNQAGCRMKLSPGQCCHYPNSAPVTDSTGPVP